MGIPSAAWEVINMKNPSSIPTNYSLRWHFFCFYGVVINQKTGYTFCRMGGDQQEKTGKYSEIDGIYHVFRSKKRGYKYVKGVLIGLNGVPNGQV